MYPYIETTNKLRQKISELFSEIGFSEPRIVENISTAEGHERMMETEAWPEGPLLNEWVRDARPSWPHFKEPVPKVKGREHVWDLWLTDYDPHLWQSMKFQKPGVFWQSEESEGMGQGVCPGPALTDPSTWLTFHGAPLACAVSRISLNYLNTSNPI